MIPPAFRTTKHKRADKAVRSRQRETAALRAKTLGAAGDRPKGFILLYNI